MKAEAIGAPRYTLTKFNGTSSQFDNGTMPPDSDGAPGTRHYVEFLNGVFSVYDKFTHERLAQVTDWQFWQQAGIQNPSGLVDPRVVFIPKAGKYGKGQWLVVQLNMGYEVYLACTSPHSGDANPLPGQWKATRFDLRGNDFPQVGFDGAGIYITVQTSLKSSDKPDADLGNDAEQKALRRSQIVFIPQSSALAFPPTLEGMKIFDPLDPAVYGSGLYPVADLTGSAWEFEPFICVNQETRRDLTYLKLMVAQRVIVSHASIPIEPIEIMPFTRVKQPSGAATSKVTYYDGAISAAPQCDGFNVWLTHTIKKNGSHLAIRWYRLAVDPVTRDLSLANWGELSDPAGHYDYFCSSIASFGRDDYSVICFSRSGDETTTSAPNDPNCGNIGAYAAIIREDGSSPTIIPIQSGLANNFLPKPGSDFVRWGDFTSIWPDPNPNSRDMWMINQYVVQGGQSSQWCEVIAKLHVEPPT